MFVLGRPVRTVMTCLVLLEKRMVKRFLILATRALCGGNKTLTRQNAFSMGDSNL